MIDEFDILMDIYAELSHNLNNIKSSRHNMQIINKTIGSLNNDYFDSQIDTSLLNDYLKMFDNGDTYNELISNLERLKLYIKYRINTICNHEWVEDDIDTDPDRSQRICYCLKCEVTKK